MMKSVHMVVVLMVSLLATAARVWSQDSLPDCVSGKFNDKGPIVLARIDSVRRGSGRQESTAIVTVDEYLRGGGTPGEKLELPVDWDGDSRIALRPPVWYKVTPDVGKEIAAFLKQYQARYYATCVVDLSRNAAQALAGMRRLVALERLSPDQDEAEFEQALSDPSHVVRLYAHQRLTNPNRRAPDTRERLFERYSQIAQDTSNPQRMEAIALIQSDFDPVLIDSPTNYRILSFMADLAADSEARVRSSAIPYLCSKFFSDLKHKPDPSHLHLRDREKVMRRLQQDIDEHRPHADKAQQLLGVIK
jgi:hypothetical protein